MTYEEFTAKQKQILAECKPLIRDFKLDEFNAKMNELIVLQDAYLEQQEKEKRKRFSRKNNNVLS